MIHAGLISLTSSVCSSDSRAAARPANSSVGRGMCTVPSSPGERIPTSRIRARVRIFELRGLVFALACLALFAMRASGQTSHTIQITNDADDGYYDVHDGTGWISTPGSGGADLVGSDSSSPDAWAIGYRFPATGVSSGDTIRSAYLEVVSSDGYATSTTCGSAPCPNSGTTFRVYGVAQDDGTSFSNAPGNTPLDVPYTTSYNDYLTTGPGDVHGSCQGQTNGQNTCIHIIDVTNIVKEVTSRPGWTNASAMRFVLLRTSTTASLSYAGFEDSSANSARAATLLINPALPTIVSAGGWGTAPTTTYPTTYATGPFVYPNASTLLLFLGDYYNFYGVPIGQPTVTDSCGNGWNILAGPTDWAGYNYFQRSTVYYVENPLACPSGDTITVNVPTQEPIFFHFLAVAGSNTGQTPITSAITSPAPGSTTATAPTASVTLTGAGLLANWIFGDSDVFPETFTPQAGFATDLESIPTYLTAVTENVSASGSYQNQFAINPADGWQTILIGVPAGAGGATSSPTVTVSPSLSSLSSTQALSVTVTVAGTPTPTGSVALTGGGYTSTATTLAAGSATIDIPSGSLSAGSDTLTVEYSPDGSSSSTYSSSTGTATVTVTAATPTVTVTPGASSVNTTQALTVTVTVNTGSGNPAATGSVVLSGGGYTSSATTLSSGSATINISSGTLSAGNYTFQANYTPDSNSSGIYNSASGSASTQVTVSTSTPTVTVTPTPSTVTTIQGVSVTVAVSGGLGNPTATGSVTLSGGGYTSAPTALSGGSATINIPAGKLNTGTDTLTASYTPDSGSSSTYSSASGTGPVVVSAAVPTVTVTPGASSISTTQPLSVTVTVSGGTGNPTATGTVTLTGGSYTSAATVLSSGAATINIPADTLSAANYTFKATYTPDPSSSSVYSSASGTASTSVTVGVATPGVTVTPGASSILISQPLSVSVTVSGGTGNPTATGTITLTGGSYTSGATALVGGTATINIPSGTLSAGNYTFKATYTPDTNSSSVYGSASGTASSVVNVAVAAPTVTVTPGTTAIPATQPLTVTVMVSGGSGNPTATGTVTLSGGSYTSTAVALSSGTATINIPANTLPPGIYTFKANYTPDSGSASTYASASGTASITVAVSTTPTVTVTPGASSIGAAQALAVAVAVTGGAGNPVPTGTVILSSGSYTSAATALSGGTVTISIPANTLSVASYTFKAVYTPDTNSSPIYTSASGTATAAVNVVTSTFSMSATPVTVSPGGSASSTITVSSTTGYSGTITLTCSITPPSGATDVPTCTGGQVNFPASSTATVSVSTTAASAALVRPSLGTGKGWAGTGGAVLAAVLIFWLPIRQKKWRALLGVVFGLVLFSTLTACGGSSGNNNSNQQTNPGTTAGSYTITITGTGNDTAKTTITTTFVLTVN
jgi:hypothetical protein